MIYLIMGVSGSGKSSIGLNLSKKLLVPFYDADDYHNIQNIEKMKKGLALNDSDRKSWLNLLALNMQKWNSEGDAFLACSALKKKYRLKLSKHNEVTFIFLNGNYDLIKRRLSKRKNHFFLNAMLQNQFKILEKPKNCIEISIDQSIENICLSIISKLKK